MKARGIISVLFAVLIISSCWNTSRKTEDLVLAGTDSLRTLINPGTGALEEIVRNYSSPLEIANLFQVMKVPFSTAYLAPALNTKKQTTSFDRGLYLGILGADLGYLNMCEKTGTSLELISSIKKLADELSVGQFFDFENIKISYTQGDPLKTEKDGGLVVIQADTSKVEMTDEQLAAIIEVTGNVKNKLIVDN